MRMRERCACGAEVEVEDEQPTSFGINDHLVVREWRVRHAQRCTLLIPPRPRPRHELELDAEGRT